MRLIAGGCGPVSVIISEELVVGDAERLERPVEPPRQHARRALGGETQAGVANLENGGAVDGF